MKVGNTVPYIYSTILVIRILAFNIGFSKYQVQLMSNNFIYLIMWTPVLLIHHIDKCKYIGQFCLCIEGIIVLTH